MDQSTLYNTILGLEDQTWRALQVDGASLLPFLSHDCIMLFPIGIKVSEKTEPSLEDVMTSEAFVPWKTYKMSDIEVTPLGPDAAVISYRVKARRQAFDPDEEDVDEEPEFRALISSTWRRDAETEKWSMCLQQQTPYQA